MKDRSDTPTSRPSTLRPRIGQGRRGAAVAHMAAGLPLPGGGRIGGACVAGPAAAVAAVVLGLGSAAWADDVISVTVRSADTGAPIQGAVVTLDETSGRELRHSLPTDLYGVAKSHPISDGNYEVFVIAVGYQKSSTIVVPLNGAPVSIDISVSPLKNSIIDINGRVDILHRDDTTISTTRSQDFLQVFPLTQGERQSFSEALRAMPGFVYDGLNQIHPRGEQDGIGIYIDGILIPQAEAGHISQVYTPQAFSSFKAITGDFSPEFGAQSGAALLLTTRPALDPDKRGETGFGSRSFMDFGADIGTLDSRDDYLDFGHEVNLRSHGNPDYHPTLDYSLSFGQQYSSDGIEPPNQSNQTVENATSSEIAFGTVGMDLTPNLRMTATYNFASGRNQVADSTGVFGFLGLNPTGTVTADQEQDGKETRQNDNENLTILRATDKLANGGTATFAVTSTESAIFVYENGSPTFATIPAKPLPLDSSWEYFSGIGQSADQGGLHGDITVPRGVTLSGAPKHTFKIGFDLEAENASEAYYYEPLSKTAATYLTANLPPGLSQQTSGSNALFVNRAGTYEGLYAQDTWRASAIPLVFNYGVRLEAYAADAAFFQNSVSSSELCPRINVAYTLPDTLHFFRLVNLSFLTKQPTVLRFGYNRLFTQPTDLGQGLLLGNLGVSPELTDQVDASLERQLSFDQIVKLNVYEKSITSVLGGSQVVPGTQDGIVSETDLGGANVNGVELQYDYNPQLKPGYAGFVVFAHSNAQPVSGDTDLFAKPVTGYLPWDQSNTLTLGGGYSLPHGAYGGLSLYYGSGLYESTDPIYGPTYNAVGPRQTVEQVNLRVGTGPMYAEHHIGIVFGVENLFDDRALLDWNSAYAGTRYEMGRRVSLGFTGKY